jgi:phosphohistidine swiveling domain-containing protein
LVSSQDWQRDPDSVLAELAEFIASGPVIVRSSAPDEDTADQSLAGHYPSIVVPAGSLQLIRTGIDAVFASYGRHLDTEVWLQRWIAHPSVTAVVTSRVVGSGAPYVVVALDRSGRTDAVTAGRSTPSAMWYVARSAVATAAVPTVVQQMLLCVSEVEQVTQTEAVDVEAAVTRSGQLMLVQARPLLVSTPRADVEQAAVALRDQVAARVADGSGRVWSCMADWNPAEMIGARPTPLAFSLYRWAITDSTWAVQRRQYGYRDVTGTPLMIKLAGKPYIDVAASLASFLPDGIDHATASAVVSAQLALLRERPDRHDKIEFELAATCLTPAFQNRVREWSDRGVSRNQISQIRERLGRITTAAFDRLPSDLARLRAIEQRVMVSPSNQPNDARNLLDHARETGLVLAHLARAAFVATDVLRSLVEIGALDPADRLRFLAGIETVPARIRRDGAAVAAGRASWDGFVEAWGHLRPGTYDIRIPRYADDPQRYLEPFLITAPAAQQPAESSRTATPWPPTDAGRIQTAFARCGLQVNPNHLAAFCRQAIAGREDAKNAYSRVISELLEMLTVAGRRVGLERQQVAWLDLADVWRLMSERNAVTRLAERIDVASAEHAASLLVCLPDCLWEPSQVTAFAGDTARPTFVGTGRVVGAPALVSAAALPPGVIVLAEAADPGHDWIFGRQIGGLVTAYGGANSHMAVRCAELGIPAAIGVGADRLAALACAHRIELDAGAATVRTMP